MRKSIKLFVIAFCGLLFFAAWATSIPHPVASDFVVSNVDERHEADVEPFYTEMFASSGLTAEAHSASAFVHGDQLTAFWYGGTAEGAADVCIYAATYKDGSWERPRMLVDIALAEGHLDRFVRKVGNPVVFQHSDGRVWLFFVSVSVGGWAGSSINLMESHDLGRTWSPARRLVTSPFLNLSTLVKQPAFEYADGTVGLPVYHEFIGKFGEILRLDPEGRILNKTRLSSGRSSLQPVISPVSPTTARGYLRYATLYGNVLYVETRDRGLTWSAPRKLDLPNPNSPVSSLQLGQYGLLILNNAPRGRHDLSLGVSTNGEDWQIVHELESVNVHPASHDYEYSYPWLLRGTHGNYHLLYTWNKKFIKHISFNQAWLNERIKR